MNNTRRRKLKKAMKEIELAKQYLDTAIESLRGAADIIEECMDEESEAYDNLPESMQDGAKGDKMQDAIDNLETALDTVRDDAEDPLSEILSTLQSDVIDALEDLPGYMDDSIESTEAAME